VADHLAGQRRNGVMVDLVCAAGDKRARLDQIVGLGALVEDIEITPPSLEDIYSHFSKGGAA